MTTLAPGRRLGPYEVISAIGEGGMGQVYRARDTRLDRIVAIKVLASSLASDPLLRERFEREARAISSLNHPNICVLHDIGRDQPTGAEAPVDYLVMEFLEGETLAARLARGPGRPSRAATARGETPSGDPMPRAPDGPSPPPMAIDEALAIAIQIAKALDRAHRQGIVHRDLKPGNVMLVKGEGGASQVKLLDFGLARLTKTGARAPEGHAGSAADADLARGLVSLADLAAPTISTPLTIKGTILGTLQYMSPEQLEGKDTDARTDIFAFGAVLYEMLTGKRPFAGKSQASLIGSILDHDPPPVASLRADVPPLLDDIVQRSLAKDPDDRWQTARDLAKQLEWVASHTDVARGFSPAITGLSPAEPAPPAERGAKAPRYLIGIVGILAGASIAAAVTAWMLRTEPPPPPVITRFNIDLPESSGFGRAGRHLLALSPDGTRLVYVMHRQLNVRLMHELTATPLRGTESEDPAEPFFSPDGQWVAYWANGQLKKVPIGGGTAVVLAKVDNPHGGSWTGDRILLGQSTMNGVVEVPSSGGPASLLVAVDQEKGELAQSPQLIAGGRAVLFTLRVGSERWDEADIVVHDLMSGKRTLLIEGGTDGQLLAGDILVYSNAATLFAARFDPRTLTIQGKPVPVQQDVRPASLGASGASQVAFSVSGAMALVQGQVAGTERYLVWTDRSGKVDSLTSPPRAFGTEPSDFRASPDGTRVAAVILKDERESRSSTQGAASDIWIWHLARGTVERLTFSEDAKTPYWTADGQRVCYLSNVEVICQPADGTGQRQTLLKHEGPGRLMSVRFVAPDGNRLLLGISTPETAMDVVMMTRGTQPEARPLVQTAFLEAGAAVSPDGRWLAYHSEESGRSEVYVRPFPDVQSGRWQVSTNGGAEPRWSADSRELFYRFTDQTSSVGGRPRLILMSVTLKPGAPVAFSSAARLREFPYQAAGAFDVAPDGRFVFNTQSRDARPDNPKIVVVQNWFEELRARLR